MSREEVINEIKRLREPTTAKQRKHISHIIRKYPYIDICMDRLPSQEELQALERCPLLDGVLIIFNHGRKQEE